MDVDWNNWQPEERGALLYVIEPGRMLLIEKKRGLGAGKVNGPGGRIDPGETPLQAAIRETQEEVGVTPHGVEPAGELQFQFTSGYSLHCYVFRATGYEGTLTETDEAKPFWSSLDALPYDRMWADDIHWFPLMLEGKSFHGRFVFDDDRMLSCEFLSKG